MSEHARFGRILRQLAVALKEHKASPALAVGTALNCWAAVRFPGVPAGRLQGSKSLATDPALVSLGELLNEGDLLSGAYWLSSAYAMLSGDDYRKSLAMFFTPPPLTGRLLDDLEEAGMDFATRSFCDPTCGGAAFLAPVALRMKAALRKKGLSSRKILAHISTHLSGVDMDPVLCELSRHFMLMALREEIVAAREVPEVRIEQGDSFRIFAGRIGTLDVIVSNPPFRKMTSAEAEGYRGEVGEVLQGQPNIYALFMALSVKLLRPGGTCALVTPTSFLSGEYFGRLRTFLRAHAHISAVSVLSDKDGVFLGVQQETAITVLEKPAQGVHPRSEPTVAVVNKKGRRVVLGHTALPCGDLAWPIPRAEEDAELIRQASRLKHRLIDYGYRARIGGFVWNRDSHKTYESIKKVPKSRREHVVPLLWSSDVDGKSGKIKFGQPKWRAEPCYVDMDSRNHSYVIRSRSVVLQRVTSNEQPRRLVAAAVPQSFLDKHHGFVGENHLVVLERVNGDAQFSPQEMTRLMTCPSVERYFRCVSGSTNVSLFELGQVPLPDPRRLRELINRGKDLQAAAEELIAEVPKADGNRSSR